MFGDHDNDEEIGEQGNLDDNSGTNGSEYLIRESDSVEDVNNEYNRELLRISTLGRTKPSKLHFENQT